MQSDCINGSPACSAPTKTQETRAATLVSTAENIIARTLANAPANDDILHGRCRDSGRETRLTPDTWLCRVAECPDLAEGTTRAGRPLRRCSAAGNKSPGKLQKCPTGYLDRHYQAVNERALGGRC